MTFAYSVREYLLKLDLTMILDSSYETYLSKNRVKNHSYRLFAWHQVMTELPSSPSLFLLEREGEHQQHRVGEDRTL